MGKSLSRRQPCRFAIQGLRAQSKRESMSYLDEAAWRQRVEERIVLNEMLTLDQQRNFKDKTESRSNRSKTRLER